MLDPAPVSIAEALPMKVQYLGDVNDYRKYALLRLLAGAGLKLGVNWLLTPDDSRTDGNVRGYLARPAEFRPYDPDLFDLMGTIPVAPTFGDFQQIEDKGVILDAVYFNQYVPAGIEAREAFHTASMQQFDDCDLVFFDPDNGLAIQSTSKSRANGIKFVFDDELETHYGTGRSLLIYQHFPRAARVQFIGNLATRLRKFAHDTEIWACHTSHVLFMLVANPAGGEDHNRQIADAIEVGRKRWPADFIRFTLTG